MLGWSEAQRNERLRETMRGYYLAFRARLEEAAEAWRADGRLPSTRSPSDVAKVILAVILGFVVQSALLGDVSTRGAGRGLRDLMRPGAGGAPS